MIVYKVTNRVNGKAYIGITSKRLGPRWNRHVADAREGAPNPLQRAIRKYGTAAFDRVVLYEAVSREEALVVERGLIAAHGTFAPRGYNVTLGGGGVPGWKRSEESKRRLSEARKGIAPTCAGMPASEEHKERLRKRALSRCSYPVALVKAVVLAGYPRRWIARRFGVERATVAQIATGRIWRLVVPDAIPASVAAEGAAARVVAERHARRIGPKPLPEPVGRPRGCRMSEEAKQRISDGLRAAYKNGRRSKRKASADDNLYAEPFTSEPGHGVRN